MTIEQLERLLEKAETLEQKIEIKDKILALKKAQGDFTETRCDGDECLMCSG